MIAIVLFAVIFMFALALLLACFAPNPNLSRAGEADRLSNDRRPRLSGGALRELAVALLDQLGLVVVEEEVRGDERRLIAAPKDPDGPSLQASRYVVFLSPSPPGDVVEQPLIVELSEYVKAERAAVGMLITPYHISNAGLAGLDVPIELVDGARLRQLAATYLPARAAQLDRFRGFPSPSGALQPAASA